MLHGWDGVLQFASFPLFLRTQQWSLWPNSYIFVSSDQRTFLQKGWSLSPCAVENRSLAFVWRFWSRGFFLAERPFRLCRYRTPFTVDIDTFVPVSSSIFTRSFAVLLGLICTFRTKVRPKSSLGAWTRLLPERYDGCVVPWCLYLRTIVCTDERGTFRHLEVLADFFWFSHDVKQRGTEFEGRPWKTSKGTPPIDSNYVN